MDCSLPGSSFHGIFQARILEWVAIAFSRGSSRPRDQTTQVSRIAGRCFTTWATSESEVKSEVAQSRPTLCDPMDCSLPGFSIHGIFQARVLEWGAVPFSQGSPLIFFRQCFPMFFFVSFTFLFSSLYYQLICNFLNFSKLGCFIAEAHSIWHFAALKIILITAYFLQLFV